MITHRRSQNRISDRHFQLAGFGIVLAFLISVGLSLQSFGLLALTLASLWLGHKLGAGSSEKSRIERQAPSHHLIAQVAHDIRSPLSALNVIMSALTELPEEKRSLIRHSIKRINDIADDLLQQHASAIIVGLGSEMARPQNPIWLVEHLDAMISEKRAQFREYKDLAIQSDLSNGEDLCARIHSSEFSRMISNLINNAAEALPNREGKITIGIRARQQVIEITIEDNGKGIPERVLEKLGERGVTHGKEGKESGSGLGVYHARKTLAAAGGELKIRSVLGSGTKVTLILPICEMPGFSKA